MADFSHSDNHDHEYSDSKEQRHEIFVQWLIQTYGHDFLTTGSGVLDVGGGKGKVSQALVRLGIPAVLLEPCRADPSPIQSTATSDICGTPYVVMTTGGFQHIVASLHGDGSELLGVDSDENSNTRIDNNVAKLVRNCSIVVGMHPDQATEAIVDIAKRLKVPFAVVPCCVYPTMFPRRRLLRRKGQSIPVRGYETFCDYLIDKGPQSPENTAESDLSCATEGERYPFTATTLPFRGKCKVIFQPTSLALSPSGIVNNSDRNCFRSLEPDLETLTAALEGCETSGDGAGALRLLKASEARLLRPRRKRTVFVRGSDDNSGSIRNSAADGSGANDDNTNQELMRWQQAIAGGFEAATRACIPHGQAREALKVLSLARRIWPTLKTGITAKCLICSHGARETKRCPDAKAGATVAFAETNNLISSFKPADEGTDMSTDIRIGGYSSPRKTLALVAVGSVGCVFCETPVSCVAAIALYAAEACENGGKWGRASELRASLSA